MVDHVPSDAPLVSDAGEQAGPFAELAVEIGPIAFGCRRLPGTSLDNAIDQIETALECGMTLIDTADVDGFIPLGSAEPAFGAAEELLGKVFAEVPELRSQLVLATKGGVFPPLPYDSSADYLRQACDASLYRLGVDVIDLYQIHRPDLLAHPAEVAEVLSELREAGKVREVGVSNYSPSQIRALQSYLDFPIVSTQVELSLLALNPIGDGSLDLAVEFGMTPLAWSPLGGGRLMGDVTGNRALAVVEVCDRIASELGVPRSAVMLSWLLYLPAGVTPIIGTNRVDRIRECALAIEVGLSRQQWYEIYAAATGRPLP